MAFYQRFGVIHLYLRLVEPVSLTQVRLHFERVNVAERLLGFGHQLPHEDTERPLEKKWMCKLQKNR